MRRWRRGGGIWQLKFLDQHVFEQQLVFKQQLGLFQFIVELFLQLLKQFIEQQLEFVKRLGFIEQLQFFQLFKQLQLFEQLEFVLRRNGQRPELPRGQPGGRGVR